MDILVILEKTASPMQFKLVKEALSLLEDDEVQYSIMNLIIDDTTQELAPLGEIYEILSIGLLNEIQRLGVEIDETAELSILVRILRCLTVALDAESKEEFSEMAELFEDRREFIARMVSSLADVEELDLLEIIVSVDEDRIIDFITSPVELIAVDPVTPVENKILFHITHYNDYDSIAGQLVKVYEGASNAPQYLEQGEDGISNIIKVQEEVMSKIDDKRILALEYLAFASLIGYSKENTVDFTFRLYVKHESPSTEEMLLFTKELEIILDGIDDNDEE